VSGIAGGWGSVQLVQEASQQVMCVGGRGSVVTGWGK
jgi:hypothetical protein